MHPGLSNRILKTRHKLVRFYLKLLRETEYRSKADFWPWVRTEPVAPRRYQLSYRNQVVCTSWPFTDFHQAAGDIAIIGSGPSVNLMRLELISKLNCILLNGAISLVARLHMEPLASVILDSTFIENRFALLGCLPPGSNLVLTPGVIRAIAERDRELLSKMKVYLTQNIQKPAYDPGPKFSEQKERAEKAHFSFDLDCGYIGGGTVMAAALQLAYQLKPKNTYLVGFDISNPAAPRFYETESNRLKCGLADSYETSIRPFMETAAVLFRQAGLNLYNCSPCSRLPYSIIPYCDSFAQ
jgi:hypothetical protein